MDSLMGERVKPYRSPLLITKSKGKGGLENRVDLDKIYTQFIPFFNTNKTRSLKSVKTRFNKEQGELTPNQTGRFAS